MFGIRPFGLAIAAMLLVAGLCDSARASAVIGGVTAKAGGSGGAVTGISFTSFSDAKSRTVDAVGNITSLQASSGTYNVIEMTVTFTELFSDFSITVNTLGEILGLAEADEVYEYLLIMNVVNDMTPINGSTKSLNGIDLNIVDNSGGVTDLSWLTNNFSGTKTIGDAGGHLAGNTSGVLAPPVPLHAGALTDTQLRFGGFKGGGGGITAADTNSTVLAAVLTIGADYFDASSGTVSGSFEISFTSNPEPGTMILGGVGLLIGGVGGYRRRRKAKAQTEQAV